MAFTIDAPFLAAQPRMLGLIRSKETADREKDRRALPYLRALHEESEG